MPEDSQSKFPKDFLWGASVAAYQVEGGNYNQWSEWEKSVAEKHAETAAETSLMPWTPKYKDLPIWPDIQKAAQDPANYISGPGVDHYNRYEEDFDIAKSLNLNAFRFTLEWSRLEPEEGRWNHAEIQHYKEYIKELRAHGLEPVLNIWHFTNPVWFEQKGGFSKKRNLKYFDRLVRLVSKEFCEDLRYILTINEPNTYAATGYLLGVWPPLKKNPYKFAKVYLNMYRVHKRAYKILRAAHPKLQIGMANAIMYCLPNNPKNPIDRLSAKIFYYCIYGWYFNRINKHQDFIGFNMYMVNYMSGPKVKDPPKPKSDFGWYMEPARVGEAAYNLWKKYQKPVIVTENGVADMHDRYRQWWLEETINSLGGAISRGADIRGYLHWSLLDNFEWATGWWPKFGLVEVDREHGMKRKVRASAKWYAERIQKS